jgi:mono/diheme cytochrome c family protein
MKKFLKYFGLLLLIIIGTVGIAALYIEVKGIPQYDPGNLEYSVNLTPEKVERGRKLSNLLCKNCHFNSGTGKLTGDKMHDAPKEFGEIFSPNITQDIEYGIGNWTDGELLYLFRTGIKKDGKYAPPWMAKLNKMADEDVDAIIAYLRSDDPLVQATSVKDQPCKPSFLSKFLCYVAFKPLKMPDQQILMPDTTDQLQLGKYLANNLECYGCHSADFKTMNVEVPELTVGFLGGGNPVLNKEGKVIVTPNITPHEENGIGRWTPQEFVNAVRFGIAKDGPALRYPMVPMTDLTEYETLAIYEYLRTVPPLNHKIVRSPL